jgi:uncharacterized protein YbbC (DUF1343 family)
MTHNESRPTMFRIGFVVIFLLAGGIVLALGPVLRQSAQSPTQQSTGKRSTAQQSAAHTKTGIDVLEEQDFAPLRGKRVGLITNQTGMDSQGRRTIDVLAHADGIRLVALFSPEHGISGNADAAVTNSTDAATGLRVYSLFGKTQRPTDEMLQGIDVLVFDIQDAGVRFYTFITTMGYSMEAAAKHKIPFIVLDRPDPLGGERIQGPLLDPERISFVGYFSMPLVYGMTLGELAQMFNAENKTAANLHVIAMKNWRRSQTYDQTGLTWIPPSPNLRTLSEDFLYPGIEILQPAGVSVGRGTDTPFEQLGAPWILSDDLMKSLSTKEIPGLRLSAAKFTPREGLYVGEQCSGVKLEVTDREKFDSVLAALEISDALHRLYPERFQITLLTTLLGSQGAVDALIAYQSPASIVAGWAGDHAKFRAMRAKYLIYD